MEEELNENELDERFYSILHYADETQENLNVNQKDVLQLVENAPRNAVRRYWRSNEESSPHQKATAQNVPPANKNTANEKTVTKPKADNRDVVPSPLSSKLLSLFQSPVSQNIKKTVEIVESPPDETLVVALDNDEDEVIEVELPPKPTITIESSDEDEVSAITEVKSNDIIKDNSPPEKKSPVDDREVTASPVPSVVSSVSDEFIRGDCIALNISSRHPNNESFDFRLHGSDLLIQTPSKKKKRKKNKDAITSTPIAPVATTNAPSASKAEACFATPKNKAKNKRQKAKSYLVSSKSLPNPDVYDSDSNQSASELNKNPLNNEGSKSAEVSLTVANAPDIFISKPAMTTDNINLIDKNLSQEKDENVSTKTTTESVSFTMDPINFVDLTSSPERDASHVSIDENIIMGNVSGFIDLDDYDVTMPSDEAPKLGSTKVPDILYADLDFNNLNGKELGSKKRRYSLTTLRAEMEKFYNESWGGENFNHREIQKYMSRDKSLWVIDPKDRISAFSKRKVTCNYCNRHGHRDDTCRLKPPVCYMCGSMGHKEPRCPSKICVNCGSPNHMYSSLCRNCWHWRGVLCAECGQRGHPATHCPDLWRRYHNTISEDAPLEENHQTKKHNQKYCSGCTRRGHLVHTCRVTVPFSGLPINSPYVNLYKPIYPSSNVNQSVDLPSQPMTPQNKNLQRDDTTVTPSPTTARADRNKRQSKSPVVHETHVNKRRNMSGCSETEHSDLQAGTKSSVNSGQKRKISLCKDVGEELGSKEPISNDPSPGTVLEKAPDFIPIYTGNHDKQGQIIQDNQVSDTSDVVTTARIYFTNDIFEKLNTPEGKEWLEAAIKKNNISFEKGDTNTYVIKGTVGQQEAFKSELRELKRQLTEDVTKEDNNPNPLVGSDLPMSNNIPKKKLSLLRLIKGSLDSLNGDIGDPKALLKEIDYLQNRHKHLLKQKIISPKQLSHNRSILNTVFKKLNMILLGQAGLADGPKHLNELYNLQEKVTNFKQDILPPQMRQEIGQHYHSIFSGTPREDYPDLLNKYYVDKNTQFLSMKNKSNKLNLTPKPKNRNIQTMSQNNINSRLDMMSGDTIDAFKKPRVIPEVILESAINKLVFYHRRLVNAQPLDAGLKKTRAMLVNRLHSQIAALGRQTNVTSKTLKKSRKIQKQAHLFLSNV